MKYYHLLTEEEIQTVCQLYPYREMIEGFKKFSKAFTDISTFRPQKISEEKGHKLMSDNSQSRLVKMMVDSLIDSWIEFISKKTEKYVSDGDTEVAAQIKAFQCSLLPGCEALYFKLIGKSVSEEYINVLNNAVSVLRCEKEKSIPSEPIVQSTETGTFEQERKEFKLVIKDKDIEIKKKQKEIDMLANEILELESTVEKNAKECEHLKKQYVQETANSTMLKNANRNLLDQKAHFEAELALTTLSLQSAQARTVILEQHEAVQAAEIDALKQQLENMQKESHALELLLHTEKAEVLYPVDMDEFEEYLGYNLNSVGISDKNEEGSLLVGFLCEILFQGKPIMCRRSTGLTMAQCVSNTICGTSEVPILSYSPDITSKDIQKYLQSKQAVCILDGFLGNFNEQGLIPLLKSASGKIVFTTFDYEHTIAYLPHEILEYFNYLNINRLNEFNAGASPDEDGSIIKLEWMKTSYTAPNKRYEHISSEIMYQLGFGTSESVCFSRKMASERTLIQYLAFSILPYAVEAFDCIPYAASKRLLKYAGEDGKCSSKGLLLRWFGDE